MEIPGVKAKVDRTFQAITGRTGPNPKCPFCLHDEWARTGLGRVVHIATVSEEDPTAETLFTTSLGFTCTHCGFVRLHEVDPANWGLPSVGIA